MVPGLPQPALERLDPEVIERTQCGIVTAPLDHGAPERGRISFDITRVGAKLPLSRQGAIFANPGGPGLDAGGAFAVHLATVWKHYARQPDWGDTYRQLADTYDVIEVTRGAWAGCRAHAWNAAPTRGSCRKRTSAKTAARPT